MDLDADGDEDDGVEGEEEEGVDEDGDDAGLELAELDQPALAWYLEQKPRRQQDEQHPRYQHRTPVLHRLLLACFFFFFFFFFFLLMMMLEAFLLVNEPTNQGLDMMMI